jgi:hypothetical protein
MGPLGKEIAEYMQATLQHITGPWVSHVDLKKWWFSQREKDMRASLVLTGGSPEYQKLYGAFLARGNELATSSHIRDAAE